MKKHVLPTFLLCAFAGLAGATPVVNSFTFTNGDFNIIIYNANTNQVGSVNSAGQEAFDGNETTGYAAASNGYSLVADFSGSATEDKPKVYVSEIEIVHAGNSFFSLYTADIVTRGNTTTTNWTPVAGAQHVQRAGTSTFKPRIRASLVKYVFDNTAAYNDLRELRIKGWMTSEPVKISALARSVFFRGGSGTRGVAGTNGGHYTDRYFNGNFTDYTYCNGSGTTELVIPTTGLDDQGNDTGVAWYVTEFKVGHQGNAQYSLYYTTEPEPANVTTNACDPRSWILIPGADHVQEAGTKTYLVNKNATAVKYVFNTCPNWTTHLAEVEVWAMDSDDLPCTHPNLDLATAAWTVCTPPTCTVNAFEECFCPDCDERFEQEVPLSKRGHSFVTTLTRTGRHDSWGSGYVTCTNTLEDPDTHETTWSCDFRIDFDGEDVDLTTLGGPPINGVVQYTDLYASSLGAEDGGIKPLYLMDGFWDNGWGHAYYFAECSSNEYVQYVFGTTIELTKIEYSVINEPQTVYFSKYDPDTGEETLLRTIPIAKAPPVIKLDAQGNAVTNEDGSVVYENVGYQRLSVDFFVSDKYKKTFVDAIRMRIGDYVDPDTGVVTPYIGYNYGSHDRHTIVCEIHPWGTIQWAGPLTHDPRTFMILR